MEELPNNASVPAQASLLRDHSDSILYQTGNPHFWGRTWVEVHGDGLVLAGFQRGAVQDTYTLALSGDELADFRRLLSSHDPRGFVPSVRRMVVPDEAPVRFLLSGPSAQADIALWSGDQETNPSLKMLIDAFSDLARRASGGLIHG